MTDKNSILYLSETFEEGQAYWSDSGGQIVDLNDAYRAMEEYAKQVAVDFHRWMLSSPTELNEYKNKWKGGGEFSFEDVYEMYKK